MVVHAFNLNTQEGLCECGARSPDSKTVNKSIADKCSEKEEGKILPMKDMDPLQEVGKVTWLCLMDHIHGP